MVKSERFSMAGYSLATWWTKNKLWFVKNKDTFKALVAALVAIAATQIQSNIWLDVLFFTGGGYVTRLILDAIDYFLSE